MIIEITRTLSGQKDGKTWVRLNGIDGEGKLHKNIVAFDAKAAALQAGLDKLVPNGVEISTRRLLIDVKGEYRDGKQIIRDGKPVTRGDGSPVLSRSFVVSSFELLDGPVLEVARIRRDGEFFLDKAEKLRAEGRIQEAYMVLAEYAARACNRPLDFILAKGDEHEDDDDLAFGDAATPAKQEGGPAPETQPEAQVASGGEPEIALEREPEVAPSPSPSAEPVRPSPAAQGFDPEASARAAYRQEDAQQAAMALREQRSAPERPTPVGRVPSRDVLEDETPAANGARPAAEPTRSPSLAQQRQSPPRQEQAPAPAAEPAAAPPPEAPARPRRGLGLGGGMRLGR